MARKIWPISVSTQNEDAIVVLKAISTYPAGSNRSALLLRWAAEYLRGKTSSVVRSEIEAIMSESELDDLLDSL